MANQNPIAGRYEPISLIGAGPVGIVYRCRDLEADVDVAVKLIKRQFLPSTEERIRFLENATTYYHLIHPNLVRYFQAGQANGRCYLAMQILDGSNLDKIIEQRNQLAGLSFRELELLISQLCVAIDQAHEEGYFHGSLKPENVLVVPELIKITDFPLYTSMPQARYLEAEKSRSMNRRYMAPEVRHGSSAVDWRSDIFSLGVMLAELLSIVKSGESSSLATLRNLLRPVVLKAISPDPQKRYSKAGKLFEDLTRIAEKVIGTRPQTEPLLLSTYHTPQDDISEDDAELALREDVPCEPISLIPSDEALPVKPTGSSIQGIKARLRQPRRMLALAATLGSLSLVGLGATIQLGLNQPLVPALHVARENLALDDITPGPVVLTRSLGPNSLDPAAVHKSVAPKRGSKPDRIPKGRSKNTSLNPSKQVAQSSLDMSQKECPLGMIWIRGGRPTPGSELLESDHNTTKHSLSYRYVRSFCIDRYEYPRASGVNLDWQKAQSLCKVQGKRLCRKNEWGKARQAPQKQQDLPHLDQGDSQTCSSQTSTERPSCREGDRSSNRGFRCCADPLGHT